VPESLEFFHDKWEGFTANIQQKLSGISVLCYDNDSSDIKGSPFPGDGLFTNVIELSYKYKTSGEKWGCVRTDLLKKLPFPNVDLEKVYYPEGYLWISLAINYKLVCYNKPLRRYYTTPTGLMQTLKKPTYNQSVMNIKFKLWLIWKIGFYMLIHSPKDFLSNLYSLSLDMIFLIKSPSNK